MVAVARVSVWQQAEGAGPGFYPRGLPILQVLPDMHILGAPLSQQAPDEVI
jgi:hypothetical protein